VARKEHACQAVAHSRRAFSEIAQSLGFAEASAFNRAFKRWTGRAPGEYRRSCAGLL
jgi:AraC-like DNA-binding protein